MNLWGHRFSQNANLKLQGFLPYQTNKDRSQKKTAYTQQKTIKKCHNPCLFGRAEILVIFGLHFGRNDDLINSFWIKLTFRTLIEKLQKYLFGYPNVYIWKYIFVIDRIEPLSLGKIWSLPKRDDDRRVVETKDPNEVQVLSI